MKYLHKLLGVITAISVTSMVATTVVTSNNTYPQIEINDLTRSFSNNYNPTVSTIEEIGNWGLFGGSNTYINFNFNNINHDAISWIVKPLPEQIVSVVSIESEASRFAKPTYVGQELAQITQNTANGRIAINQTNHSVALNFTLKLWKDNGLGSWVKQNASMVVTVNVFIGGLHHNLSNLIQLSDINQINITTADLRFVQQNEILASHQFKESIQNDLIKFASFVPASYYTIILASSTNGQAFQPLDLSHGSKAIYVQITASAKAINLDPNSKTDFLRVNLGSVNDLEQITANDFGALIKYDFSDTKSPAAITRSDILVALAKNGSIAMTLHGINNYINEKNWYAMFNYKISKIVNGPDMTQDETIDATKPAGVTIYITIIPGTSHLISGITSGGTGGLAVQIPYLPEK